MKQPPELREPARILKHLSEGYTKGMLERAEGPAWPTAASRATSPPAGIPAPLRAIGSRFMLVRAGPRFISVEPLP